MSERCFENPRFVKTQWAAAERRKLNRLEYAEPARFNVVDLAPSPAAKPLCSFKLQNA